MITPYCIKRFCICSDTKFNELKYCNLSDIIYIESLKDYIKIVAVSGPIVTRQSISSIKETLPKDMFLRIHRSFIIALNKIESYSTELVWVGKTELPISRMYRHEVEKILKQK